MTLLSALLAGIAVLASGRAPGRRYAPRAPVRPTAGAGRSPHGSRHRVRAGAAVLLGVGSALVVGGPAGLVLGAVAALTVGRALSRLDRPASRGPLLLQEMPLALDLTAACLAAGLPLQQALAEVGAALPGPLGEDLARAAGALVLGAPPAQAFTHLTAAPEVPARARSAFGQLAAAVEEGTRVAEQLDVLAQELRADDAAEAVERARRVGVWAAAPLGLCFLPAFLVLGVVPLVTSGLARL